MGKYELPIEKWYKVKLPAYKFILEQAEKKLEDVLSESESITNKSIKMLTGMVVMFGFFIGFFVQNKIPIGYNVIFIGDFIITTALIMSLLLPKEVKGRGFVPVELIPKDFDNDEDKDFQEELLYYSAIGNLQRDIQFMRKKNANRVRLYSICLALTLLSLSVGTVIIGLYI